MFLRQAKASGSERGARDAHEGDGDKVQKTVYYLSSSIKNSTEYLLLRTDIFERKQSLAAPETSPARSQSTGCVNIPGGNSAVLLCRQTGATRSLNLAGEASFMTAMSRS